MSGVSSVLFDGSSKDIDYVKNHLEEAIIDMKVDRRGLYASDDIGDAIQVYASLPESLEEARDIVVSHLAGHDGLAMAIQSRMFLIGAEDGGGGGGEGEEQQKDASENAEKSAEQLKADRAAAKNAVRAASLEEKAKAAEAKRLGILESASKRAEKKRQRGLKRQAALEKRAAALKEDAAKQVRAAEAKAAKEKQNAAKKVVLAGKREDAGAKKAASADKSAIRTEKFGNFRARWAARTAERLRKRAEKARGAPSRESGGEEETIGNEAFYECETIGASLEMYYQDIGFHICEVCTKRAEDVCSGCSSMWYCSNECQNADWYVAGHDQECSYIKNNVPLNSVPLAVLSKHQFRVANALGK